MSLFIFCVVFLIINILATIRVVAPFIYYKIKGVIYITPNPGWTLFSVMWSLFINTVAVFATYPY